MGQKVNPHGLRVGVIKDWDSRWYAREDKVGDLIVEDYNIRKYLKSTLYSAGIAKIEIERDNAKVKISIHCSRPGVIIGKGGTEIEVLRQKIEAKLGKTVALNIVEVRSPDLNAQLVAENIAAQLEKRISFRRAMKQAIQRATRLGAKGIKCTCGGRLGGAEIARSESYHEGTIPLQTIRADIDYGFAEANTTYGRVGCKVWIYKGEVLNSTLRSENPEPAKRERRDRRPNDRRGGDRRGRVALVEGAAAEHRQMVPRTDRIHGRRRTLLFASLGRAGAVGERETGAAAVRPPGAAAARSGGVRGRRNPEHHLVCRLHGRRILLRPRYGRPRGLCGCAAGIPAGRRQCPRGRSRQAGLGKSGPVLLKIRKGVTDHE